MTRYEKRIFFEAIQRVLGATSPSRKAAVEVSDWMEDADLDFEWEPERDHRARRVTKEEWRLLHRQVERQCRALSKSRPGQRDRAIGSLGKMVNLNDTEVAILRLALHSDDQHGIGGLCDLLIDRIRMDRHSAIALLVGHPASKVRNALARKGRLFSTGLIERPDWSRGRNLDLNVPRQIGRLIEGGCSTPAKFRKGLFPAAPQPTTEWDDFKHLRDLHDLSVRILKGAACGRHHGVNLLFYGPPGTGKTEFCKVLTRQIGKTLHAVGETDGEGEAPTGRERSSALQLAQRLLSDGQEGILLFDEMEDILDRDFFSAISGRRTGSSKIHLHRVLETNPVPVLWTTNDIESCDPALLRRMTLTVEMRTPGPRVREQVWKRLAERKNLPLDNDKIRELAWEIEVPPALVTGALGVAQLTGGGERDLDLALGAADKALRGGHLKPPSSGNIETFDPSLVVTDLDITRLIERLRRPDAARNVSFCFSGQPGTGKSALARYLAKVMGLPVIQKRASDLLSMFVGGSEKAIASAFSRAREEGAFLIFDEADSLLGNRASATRSWEVSQVNEMLTWMESHPLPFACTTNLADRLDPATRRRFTVNAEVRSMGTSQLGIAFRKFFEAEPPLGLFDLEGLTPGDMAAVSRRCKLLGEHDKQSILAALQEEAHAKDNGGISPGFRPSFKKSLEIQNDDGSSWQTKGSLAFRGWK